MNYLLLARTCVALGLMMQMLSCGGGLTAEESDPKDNKMVLDDIGKPKKIRFVSVARPLIPSPQQDKSLPVTERIRLETRRYAEYELRNRGLCPNGFIGPDSVIGNESDRRLRIFTIECLPY
jgi:hypothetical protein